MASFPVPTIAKADLPVAKNANSGLTSEVGGVRPDGITIFADTDGTISTFGNSGGSTTVPTGEIDMPDLFSGANSIYEIEWCNIVPTSAGFDIGFQFFVGSSYDTGNNYEFGRYYTSTALVASSAPNSTTIPLGLISLTGAGGTSMGTDWALNGRMRLYVPNSSTAIKQGSLDCVIYQGAGHTFRFMGGIKYPFVAPIKGLRLVATLGGQFTGKLFSRVIAQ